jgi:Peptidase family M1 domain
MLALFYCTTSAWAQPIPACPQTTAALYESLRSVELDPQRVYHVRDANIDRPNLHLDLDDGTLAFTKDICGRITGAFFVGDGEIRMRPPHRVERASLALFTNMAILEEQFNSGYLRFNDDTASVLQPFLSKVSEDDEFVQQSAAASRNLAEFDTLRLFVDFSHFLPAPAGTPPPQKFPAMLHVHLSGKRLGPFEVFWDAASPEPLWAGQSRIKDGILFFDIWTSFAPNGSATPATLANDAAITSFQIKATIQPPLSLRATTDAKIKITSVGERALLFELSRYLKVDVVESNGRPVDFIQNPAIEGSQLQRKGDDLIAVVFPAPLTAGQELQLHFSYAGDVLSEAGSGLLYVGERGIWYPNFGLNPALFEMEFHYPAIWTLLATGKQITRPANDDAASDKPLAGEKVSRWISERPIPVAGFNLGKYLRAEAKAGNVLVEAYATKGVEKSFPKPKPEVIEDPHFPGQIQRSHPLPPLVVIPATPSPAHDAQAVADRAAKAIASFSQWFGPFPYASLALTQMPGNSSQGWPGLVFLSSLAFLSTQEQKDLHLDQVHRDIDSQILVHETAHQWWGDLILWKTYHDQWIAEGLANYASLMTLEQQNPAQFHEILEKYRHDLLGKNKDGENLRDAGPVTLGLRLESSHFPDGYDAISYERGTWLFHMLRCMFRDSASHQSSAHETKPSSEWSSRSRKGKPGPPTDPDEPFFRTLRKIRERYAGKSVSTEEFIKVFEEELPRPLWYEHRRKLDWFLEGWIEGTAIPQLETRDIRITQKPGAAAATVQGVIVQKDAPEDLVTAVPVYAMTANNALVFLGEVLADGPETTFHLSAPAGAHKIVLDPNQTILTAPK